MKEITNQPYIDMQTAVSLQSEQSFRENFGFRLSIPQNLQFLEKLSWNFYWSWSKEGTQLFRDLDSRLWEKCEQNPRQLLRKTSELRLWQKANEEDYVLRLNNFEKEFNEYMSQEPNKFGKITQKNPVAYFCAEYGIHNSLPIYSGGLGILAGDHLKSASDMNVPLVSIGLMYRFGYFRQNIDHDGYQKESYRDAFVEKLALRPVNDENGERIIIRMHIRGREVIAQAWLAQIGRISLYLLDTNLEQNDEIDRFITGHLYGGDEETRVVQEKLLGIGGVRLLRKLGIDPSVYHLNEGHSAFLTLELAREILEKDENLTFSDVASIVRNKCVFTTHTPVAAGNDSFSPELVESCFDENYINALRLDKDEFFSLGRSNPDDKDEWFGMTPLAIRLSRSANGVSEKHGEVSRELWLKMFPEDTKVEDVPITHITNGVHPLTWIAPTFKTLYEHRIDSNWHELLSDGEKWAEAIENLPDEEVWRAHQLLKQLLISFIREKTHAKNIGRKETIHENISTRKLFDKDVLTIGFARRIAAYKRWNLLMTDLDRLLKMVDDDERPVQFVFAGKAHPQDRKAKKILQNLMSINHKSNWQKRAVFIEDYDQEIARYLVQGVDVWMNVPRRPLEASGTSGQKVAMNGGLNFSILDGWWIEGFNSVNGFAIGAIGTDEEDNDESVNDKKDAESFYSVLENEIIPTYYSKDENDLPTKWIERMKNALATLTPQFSSDRMLKDYIEQIYL